MCWFTVSPKNWWEDWYRCWYKSVSPWYFHSVFSPTQSQPAVLFVCIEVNLWYFCFEAGRSEPPRFPLASILLPVVVVFLALVSVMLLCLWRSHKGQPVFMSVTFVTVTFCILLFQRYFCQGRHNKFDSVVEGHEMQSQAPEKAHRWAACQWRLMSNFRMMANLWVQAPRTKHFNIFTQRRSTGWSRQ